MTLRISQFAAVCGLGLLALPGVVQAQAPRYQSPLSAPNAPQPQLTLPVTPAITPNGTVVEDVVVHVNDLIISRSDVERAEVALAQENQQAGATPAEAAERQKNLLRDMIDKQLLLSRGKELGINADAEVIRRLDEIRKQNKMDTLDDLEKAARQQGVSYEDFKAGIRDNVITQMVVRDEVGRRLQLSQSQEQAYYDAHKQEFTQPEQIKLSEILVPTPADANDAAIAQAQAKAEDLEAKLKAGEIFEDLAKANSGGPTATQGGDLGMYKRGALAKVLEDQTFNLKPGEWTAPIRTRQGFVILKVTDHVAAGVAPLKDVEQQVQEGMYAEAMQPALRAYLTKLREDAAIDIRAGYVDSGASPKETKPVFTAYAPPVAKKKSVQQKKRFDRGTTFSTATKSATAPAAAATAVAATPATTSIKPTTAQATAATKPQKPQKVKREKVRYGQAPRNSLPAGPEETASGTDVGEGATSAAVTPGGTMAASAAPGTAIAPLEGSGQVSSSSNTDPNPLEAHAAVEGKTRYSARAKQVSAEKKTTKLKKVNEKKAATPAGPTPEEKAAEQTQAAPLGLNGDTSQKKKKQPKDKNAPKERLQNKAPTPPPPPPDETPSKAPNRATPLEGTLPPAPKSPDSTVPPATGTPPTTPPQQ
ncbi:MAG TPA: peptidyl-prolyl cis-trans isomerase [Edaphobacter sp.]|jgi:peptidyl-prolyl cis-trans isomerase SurA|nr:peptidyl-prolyl cis-trans isomerase [Edaphobacter sp.]